MRPQPYNEPLVYDFLVRDLEPENDPKGGSPKTPFPPITQPEQGFWIQPNGGTIWRAIATGLGGLLVGMTIAWFTALWSHGLSQKEVEDLIRESQIEQEKHLLSRIEMQEYVTKFSPWSFDKQAITNRLSNQDQAIGELRTKIDLAADLIKKQTVKP